MDIYLFDSEESFRKFNKSMSDIFGLEYIELQYNPEHYKVSSDMDNNFNRKGISHTEETKNQIGINKKGQIPWNKGKTNVYNEETLNNMSQSLKGRIISKEWANKISDSNKGKKKPKDWIDNKSLDWIVIDPNNNTIQIRNLKQFCRDNDLGFPNMVNVSKGIRTHHKGWKCIRL